jgi:hypothetical protein
MYSMLETVLIGAVAILTLVGVALLLIKDHVVELRRRGMSAIWPVVGVFLLIGVVAAILLPLLGPGRTPALRTRSASHLNQIAIALTLYADANQRYPTSGNAFPNSTALWLLYPDYVADPAVFCNPRDPEYSTHVKTLRKSGICKANADIIAAIDYTFVEGLDPSDALNILAYEKVLIGDGRNVVYVGGSVEFLTEVQFQKAITKQLNKCKP